MDNPSDGGQPKSGVRPGALAAAIGIGTIVLAACIIAVVARHV
jgi:hypothetical protein